MGVVNNNNKYRRATGLTSYVYHFTSVIVLDVGDCQVPLVLVRVSGSQVD